MLSTAPESAASTASAASDSDFQTIVLRDFPSPLAFAYEHSLRGASSVARLENLLYCYETALRLSALLLSCQFLKSGLQDASCARALRRLLMPHLNDWYMVVCAFLKRRHTLFSGAIAGRSANAATTQAAETFFADLLDGLTDLRDSSVHEQLLLLRNRWAHGGVKIEQDAADKLSSARAAVDRALRCLMPLADIVLLRDSPSGVVRLAGRGPTFPVEPLTPDERASLFVDSRCAARGKDGSVLPLDPLLLAPPEWPETLNEPVVMFSGLRRKEVEYVGAREHYEHGPSLAAIRELLLNKGITPGFSARKLERWSVVEWARHSTRITIEALSASKYLPDFYQEREKVEGVLRDWLRAGNGAAALLAGEAGVGKTSLLCRLADTMLKDDRLSTDCLLLLTGEQFRTGATLFERIREGLGFAVPAPELPGESPLHFAELLDLWDRSSSIEDLEEGRRLIVLIDAVNESADPKRLFEDTMALALQGSFANARRGRPWVRILISTRSIGLSSLLSDESRRSRAGSANDLTTLGQFEDDSSGELRPFLRIPVFSESEAADAYDRYLARVAQTDQFLAAGRLPWHSLPAETRELLRRPLMLRLYWGPGTDGSARPHSEEDLWQAWWSGAVKASGGADLERLAFSFSLASVEVFDHDEAARRVREQWLRAGRLNAVGVAVNLDPLERLEEAGVLRRTATGSWDWSSDALGDRIYAKALIQSDPALSSQNLLRWLKKVDVSTAEASEGGVPLIRVKANTRLARALAEVGAQVLWCREAYKLWGFKARPQVGAVVLASAVKYATANAQRQPGVWLGALERDLLRADADTQQWATRAILDQADWQDGEASGAVLEMVLRVTDEAATKNHDSPKHAWALVRSLWLMADYVGTSDPTRGETLSQRAVDLSEGMIQVQELQSKLGRQVHGEDRLSADAELACALYSRSKFENDAVRRRQWIERSLKSFSSVAGSHQQEYVYDVTRVLNELDQSDDDLGPSVLEARTQLRATVAELFSVTGSMRRGQNVEHVMGNEKARMFSLYGDYPDELAQNRPVVVIPHPHPRADADQAARLNIEHQERLREWKQLPWMKRIFTKKPLPPAGI